MNRIVNADIQIEFLRDLCSLKSTDDRMFRIGLLGVDIENVVSPYGGYSAAAEYVDVVQELQDGGVNVVMLSNMRNSERAGLITEQLGAIGFLHKGMLVDSEDESSALPSKSHSEIYQAAIDSFGFGRNGDRAAMVDDQLKNIGGASQVAAFTKYFWTYPNFFTQQHKGVLAGRVVEVPAGAGIIVAQRAVRIGKAVKKLATGQYGEW